MVVFLKDILVDVLYRGCVLRSSRGMGAINPAKIPKSKKHRAAEKPVASLPPVFNPKSIRDMHRRATRVYP